MKQEYNLGLFTAIVIFLPSFFWLSKACFGKEGFAKKGIAVLISVGIILHVILISSLFAFVNQKISSTVLNFIQVINASTIILLPWLADKLLKVYDKRGRNLPLDLNATARPKHSFLNKILIRRSSRKN